MCLIFTRRIYNMFCALVWNGSFGNTTPVRFIIIPTSMEEVFRARNTKKFKTKGMRYCYICNITFRPITIQRATLDNAWCAWFDVKWNTQFADARDSVATTTLHVHTCHQSQLASHMVCRYHKYLCFHMRFYILRLFLISFLLRTFLRNE